MQLEQGNHCVFHLSGVDSPGSTIIKAGGYHGNMEVCVESLVCLKLHCGASIQRIQATARVPTPWNLIVALNKEMLTL